jgi:hypothetical protein
LRIFILKTVPYVPYKCLAVGKNEIGVHRTLLLAFEATEGIGKWPRKNR